MTTNDDMNPRQPDGDEPLEELFGAVFDLVDKTVSRITDAEVDEQLRKVLSQADCGDSRQVTDVRQPRGIEPDIFLDLNCPMDAAITPRNGEIADLMTVAWTNYRLSGERLQQAQEALEAARQEAEGIVTAAREEADEALKQAAKMVRDAREQAERIISHARRAAQQAAEEIIPAAEDKAERITPFDPEEGDFAFPVKGSTWQEAATRCQEAAVLVGLDTCKAMTGFTVAHGTINDIPEKDLTATGTHLEKGDTGQSAARRRLAGSDDSRDDSSLQVFISHASEPRNFLKEMSYAAEVERAIFAAGYVIVDMTDFGDGAQAPARVCAEQVREYEVYVGILGTRYGSQVKDNPDLSYTELEFGAATEESLNRLVFLLDTAADRGAWSKTAIRNYLTDHQRRVAQDKPSRALALSALAEALTAYGYTASADYPQLREAETEAFGRLLCAPLQRLAVLALGGDTALLPGAAARLSGGASEEAEVGGQHVSGQLTMYTTSWCGYCRNLKRHLARDGIKVIEVDIERDEAAAEFVMSVNDGHQIVPTVVFTDGTVLANPSAEQVKAHLAIAAEVEPGRVR